MEVIIIVYLLISIPERRCGSNKTNNDGKTKRNKNKWKKNGKKNGNKNSYNNSNQSKGNNPYTNDFLQNYSHMKHRKKFKLNFWFKEWNFDWLKYNLTITYFRRVINWFIISLLCLWSSILTFFSNTQMKSCYKIHSALANLKSIPPTTTNLFNFIQWKLNFLHSINPHSIGIVPFMLLNVLVFSITQSHLVTVCFY